MIKAKIITRLDDAFQKQWRNLWKTSTDANYTNSPAWFAAALETFSYKEYIIVAIYTDEQLAAVAAFVKEKKFYIDFYTVPPENFIYGNPFLLDWKNEKLVETLIKTVATLGNIFLQNIPETYSSTLKAYVPQMIATFSSMNYYFDFAQNTDGQINIPHRSKLLRKVKDKRDAIHIASYVGHDTTAFEAVVAIDSQSSKQSRGYNAFSQNHIQPFYLNLAKLLGNKFRIFLLYFHDTAIAYRIGFVIGNTYYGSQTAFLHTYQHLWPGNVSLVMTAEYLANMGVKRIDFGSGDTYSKRSVSNGSRILQNCIIARNIFTRYYITILYAARATLYSYLRKHPRIYTLYRAVKNRTASFTQ